MSSHNRVAGLAAGLAALLVASTAGTTHASDVRFDVDNGVRFRASAGLVSSRAIASRATSERAAFPNLDWGVPLTEAEASILHRRSKLQLRSDKAIDYAASQPGYAGMYFDHQDDGRAVFRFTKDRSQHRTRLGDLLPSGQKYVVRDAAVSLRTLEDLADRIFDDADQLGRDGVKISSVGVDPVTNKVTVGLDASDPDAIGRLKAAYGDRVRTLVEGRLTTDACTGRGNCPDPWKGALRIHPQGCSACQCTSAFLARKPNNNLVMVTAGHCVAGTAGTDWKHANGDVIGEAKSGHTWTNGSTSDVGWIDVEGHSGARNQFLAVDKNDIRSITGIRLSQHQHVGNFLCRSAEETKYICGFIHERNSAVKDVDGRDIKKLYKTDFDADVGDSGGIYFLGNIVYGIHADSKTNVSPPASNGRSWYTPAQRAEDKASLDICTSSGC